MSFILDALQKSERERHAGQTPAIDEALSRPLPTPRRGRRSDETELVIRTVLAVSAVFLIAGLTWWLLSRAGSREAPVPDMAMAVEASDAAAVQPTSSEPAAEVAVPAPAAPIRVDPERLQAPIASADLGPDAASLDELLDAPEETPAAAPPPEPPPLDALPQPTATAAVSPPPRDSVRPLKDMPPSFRSEFPALSNLSQEDAEAMVKYILLLKK